MHKDSVAHQYCMGAFAQASEAANGPIPVLARVLKLARKYCENNRFEKSIIIAFLNA